MTLGKVDGTRHDGYQLHGELTLRHITRPVTARALLVCTTPDTLHATGELGVDIRDFQLEPPRLLGPRVHPEVAVAVRIVATTNHDQEARRTPRSMSAQCSVLSVSGSTSSGGFAPRVPGRRSSTSSRPSPRHAEAGGGCPSQAAIRVAMRTASSSWSGGTPYSSATTSSGSPERNSASASSRRAPPWAKIGWPSPRSESTTTSATS